MYYVTTNHHSLELNINDSGAVSGASGAVSNHQIGRPRVPELGYCLP